MVRRKYIAFLTLTLLSLLLVSVVLGPALIEAPPGTKSIEEILSPKLPPGNETNETGPPVEAPASHHFVLLVTGAAHTHYLRLNVYTDYTDGRWTTGNATVIPGNVIAPPEIKVPHHTERDRVTVVSFLPLSGNLFTPLYTTRVDGAGAEAIPEYNLFRTSLNVTAYSFSAVGYTFDMPYLVNLTAGNQTVYLSAPNDTRLVTLAESITMGARSDYWKALSIVRYLASNYRHVENVTPPEGADRLTWFLFESKAGSSYDFASAFVVLARLNGLPARLVEGVYIDAVPQTQVVTEKNRHFWAEVYFKDAGWLVFDPLHPTDQNVYLPFELEAPGVLMPLEPGSSGTVTIKFERVASGANASVAVDVPAIGRIALIGEPGIYNLTVGPFEEPGYYPVMVRATDREGNSLTRIVPVTVPGNVSALPDPVTAYLRKNDALTVELTVPGTGEVGLKTESPLVDSWFSIETLRNETRMYVRLIPPDDYPNGWHIENLTVTRGADEYKIHLPVFVVERTEIKAEVPGAVTAGDSFVINGTVEGSATGERPRRGSVAAFINDGERDVLIGYANASNGTFALPVKIPAYLSPGTKQVFVYYLTPLGYPYLPSGATFTVEVRGLARFSMPGLILARPGNVTVIGSLLSGAGGPIANASIEYYLDGRPLGETPTLTDGRFSLVLQLPTIESHVLTVRYPGSPDYSPSAMNVTVATVELKVPERITGEIGEPIRIGGKVAGIEDAALQAYVFPGKTYPIDVTNGSFELTIEPFQTVGERSVEFRHGTRTLGRTTVVVLSPVEIELLTPRVEGEKTAALRFRVVDSSDNPVSGVYLNVSVDGFAMRVMTNGSGIATLEVPVPEKETNATVVVDFDGSSYYLPASGRFHVVISRKRGIPWTYIAIALVIGALIVRYRLVRREPEKKRAEKVLKIIFNNGIPVFREGETVELSIECEGKAELYVDGKLVGRGRDFTLTMKGGEHTIEARCGELIERATVRIVPRYDDAVVDYYERCFLPWARGAGLNVEGMTPREIAAALTDMMYPWEPLDTLTEVFERAKYSTVEVSRGEFIRFYRSLLELVGGGCIV
ncbi:hypothetical protein GQS_08300 [Thermococcus sp. 4557]|uniref:transglutaminase domain-containing protein n=1 Tax=Thermococcus sp. (strain CGMCC 1.5172 / 4557) TaxID=1042877 RepID=UPI000219EDA7|nr:transglutaminase domain-containing protein [Thermococcus sp. 4557]AEK73554.1 hypothetical protein GQS_08300 [Thermococcus sp. 4557]